MRKFLRYSATIIVLVLIVSLIPLSYVHAVSQLTCFPLNGPVGTTVTVSGNGTSGETVSIQYFDGVTTSTLTTVQANPTWIATFTIPASTYGAHTITALGNFSGQGSINFTVTSKITTAAATGTGVAVSGTGYAANESINVTVDGGLATTTTAGANGSWQATITTLSGGSHLITATGTTGTAFSTTYNVIPTVTLSRQSGTVGTSVTVTGSGFAVNEANIRATFDNTPVGSSTTASSSGAWTLNISVPAAAGGSHFITAGGSVTATSAAAAQTFTITPVINLSKNSGTPDTSVTVTGSGFGGGESGINVTYDGNPVGTPATAGSDGSWTVNFNVPAGKGGSHPVGAYGSNTAASAVASVNFTIAGAISLSTSSGNIGSTVTVNGAGFSAQETGITVLYDGSPIGTTTTASATGTWSSTFSVPAGKGGAHSISAKGSTTAAVPAQNFSIGAGISIKPDSGSAGTSVAVSGTGFGASETGIKVTFDGTAIAQTATADASGSWTLTFNVPAAPSGSHSIVASGSVTTSVPGTTFNLASGTSINPPSGPVGSSITISATGFAASEPGITVTYDSNPLGSTQSADKSGGWSSTFVIPQSAKGAHTIGIKGTATTTVNTLSFTVTPSLTSSANSGFVGSSVTLSLNGFAANSILRITYDDNPISNLGAATTDGNGSYTKAITIPVSKSGSHTLKVQDAQNNTSSLPFVINTEVLSTPNPISPADGSKLGMTGGITPDLRWSPVSGPNGGITYDLQIDNDRDFPHPILDKTGLTVPHYTLTVTEALEAGTYYWRVRANDAASSQSAWSQTVTLQSGMISQALLIFLILIVIVVVIAVVVYLFVIRPGQARKKLARARREAVPEPALGPEIVMPEVVDADYRTIDSEDAKKKATKALPWRLALPQAPQPTKGAKSLSREDQARLKVIVDFTKSIVLVEPGNTATWLIEMAETVSGEPASPELYSKLLKSELQLQYEPVWMRHPTFVDLRTLLEGQPILQDLNSFVESVNYSASEAIQLLQDVFHDSSAEFTGDILASGGWGFVSAIYTDSVSWFMGKYLKDPSERDYSIKAEGKSDSENASFGLYGEQNTPYAGLLITAADEKEAIRLRTAHLKLRRSYRNSDRPKEVVSSITQLDVQRSRLLNDFSQFSRLNA